MSVSTINAGLPQNQSALKGALPGLPQRANAQAAPAAPATAQAQPAPAAPQSLPAPTRHANLVGVAAYAAIMNPSASTSMRTEA